MSRIRGLDADEDLAHHKSIRIEILLHGRKYTHEVTTDVLLRSIASHRRGEDVVLDFDCVRITLREDEALAMTSSLLQTTSDDRKKWRVVEPTVRDLHERGYDFRID